MFHEVNNNFVSNYKSMPFSIGSSKHGNEWQNKNIKLQLVVCILLSVLTSKTALWISSWT